jgi:hypothetical protein
VYLKIRDSYRIRDGPGIPAESKEYLRKTVTNISVPRKMKEYAGKLWNMLRMWMNFKKNARLMSPGKKGDKLASILGHTKSTALPSLCVVGSPLRSNKNIENNRSIAGNRDGALEVGLQRS